ncbi:hypothetical protein SLS56_011499 [Neofusicoccum ribis]|uniref:DUF7924 domain-containing protein n=1 Tax=Neofusicoccum ribis TaxID=45134 RepID=A0ABR3SBG4_9PEZI
MDAGAIQHWLEGTASPPSSPARKRAHSPAVSKRRRCDPPLPAPMPPTLSSSSAPPSSASASDAHDRASPSPRSDRYRSANLQLNGFFIAASLDASSAPPSVRDQVHTLLEAPRAPIAAEQLERWAQNIIHIQDNGEEAVALSGSGGLLPDASYCARLRRMDGLPFANAKDLLRRVADVPALIAANVPRVRTPVPDVAFGLGNTAFAKQQILAMAISPTSCVCEPISSLYWPFFVLGYKAQAKGGSIYVAVNQCAGSGSACIKAQATLKTPASSTHLV